MEEMKSTIDMILSEDCTDNIVLYDENNVETEFEQVAVIPMDEMVYVLLKPVIPPEGETDDVAYVFRIEEIDDEDALVMILDDETVERVFEEYYRLLEEEGQE
ncbi:MAG: DUF1292 domain-containing protein [Clostridia bacterium]|nr:DUF1292 domain-containing protein [Clostridia bacterium]